MAVRSVHLEPRYLLPESFNFIFSLFKSHPILATFGTLAVFGVVLGILKKSFGRIGYDTIVFAILVSSLIVWVATALYLLTNVEGFRFFGG